MPRGNAFTDECVASRRTRNFSEPCTYAPRAANSLRKQTVTLLQTLVQLVASDRKAPVRPLVFGPKNCRLLRPLALDSSGGSLNSLPSDGNWRVFTLVCYSTNPDANYRSKITPNPTGICFSLF